MGQSASLPFTSTQLEEYEDCTFFTANEINKIHKIYMKLLHAEETILSKQTFLSMPQIQACPFKERFVDLFSEHEEGHFSFEDFLDFFSAFSPYASTDVKAFTAFKIYDYDGDGYIDREDVRKVVVSLVGIQLEGKELNLVIENIIKEIDVDGDAKLSFVEFDQVVRRAPDFATLFTIRIV